MAFVLLPVTSALGAGASDPATVGGSGDVVADAAPDPLVEISGNRSVGDTLAITGTGFTSGEMVSVSVAPLEHSGTVGEEYGRWDVLADADGMVNSTWTATDESQSWQPLVVKAVGEESGLLALGVSNEIDSRLAILDISTEILAGFPFDVTILLEQNCCDGNFAPMGGREILFYAHHDECGVDLDQDPLAVAVTDEYGMATATLTLNEVDQFTIGVKYAGEEEPGESDPPNSVCYPDERVRIIASIDCTKIEVDYPPPDIQCDSWQGLACDYDNICLVTTVLNEGAGQLSFSIAPESPATIDPTTGELCLTPDATGTYEIEITATDAIGQTAACMATYVVEKNLPPVVTCPDNASDTVCDLSEICVAGFEYSDPNGNLGGVTAAVNGVPAAVSEGSVCFVPSEGVNSIVLTATDDCGLEVSCTTEMTIVLNADPVVSCPDNSNLTVCDLNEICAGPFAFSDPDGDLSEVLVTVNGQPASIVEGQVCFVPIEGVNSISVTAIDACGNESSCGTAVDVTLNSAPVVTCPDDRAMTVCDLSEICVNGFGFSDPDRDIAEVLVTVNGQPASMEEGQVCFVPVEGVNSILVTVTDDCGNESSCATAVDVSLNSAPVVVYPPGSVMEVCDLSEICVGGFGYSDADGDVDDVAIAVNGRPVELVEGTICFMPDAGVNTVTITVMDACGNQASGSTEIDVVVNIAPVVTCPENSSLRVCSLDDEIVIEGFDYYDPDGNLVAATVTVNGAPQELVDGAVRFVPSAGINTVVLTVTDACGDVSCETAIEVAETRPLTVQVSDTAIYLCYPQQICLPVLVDDPDETLDNIVIDGADYVNGAACLTPYSSGVYDIVVTAYGRCNQATASAVVTIRTDQDIDIVCPGDTTVFACGLDTFSFPIDSIPESDDISVAISGTNAWYEAYSGKADTVRFTSECSQSNHIVVSVTTPCSDYTCDFTVFVDCNVGPLVILPPDTAFVICEPAEICLPVGISDPNNNLDPSTVVINGVVGAVFDPATSRVCFVPDDASAVYSVQVEARDECGVISSDEILLDVTVNSPPVVVCPDDAALTICDLSEICIDGFEYGDPDGNLADVVITVNGAPATLVEGEVCFIPVEGSNVIAITATDECGAQAVCETMVDITFNQDPTVTCPDNRTLTVCDLSEICIDGFSYGDPDGDLLDITVTVNGVPATLVEGAVCFIPVEGRNVIALTAVDLCGNEATCATEVSVILNSAPVVTCPGNTTMAVCDLGEICLDGFDTTDPDGDIIDVTLTVNGEPANIVEGSVCFVPLEGSNVVALTATDACGNVTSCTTEANVILNGAPVVTCPENRTLEVCDLSEICIDGFEYSDPDDDIVFVAVDVNGIAVQLVEGSVCFVPVGGANIITVTVTDACGNQVSCATEIDVVVNSAPVVSCPGDQTRTECTLDEICVSGFDYSDPDNDLSEIIITVNGEPVSIIEGSVCFIPVEGSNVIAITAVDLCGNETSCATKVSIILNSAPVVTCPGTSTLTLCDLTKICVDGFDTTDPDGDIVDVMLTVNGAPATLVEGSVCFFPVEGSNIVTLTATDACGNQSSCVTEVVVVLNSPPELVAYDSKMYLCQLQDICFTVEGSDPDGDSLVIRQWEGPGGFTQLDRISGQTCFTPQQSDSATYVFVYCVDDSCSLKSPCADGKNCPPCDEPDTIRITVILNRPPVVICPEDAALTVCDLSEICIDGFEYSDPDGDLPDVTVTVNGAPATLVEGEVCFIPVEGSNVVALTATDECGARAVCETVVDITLNQVPTVTCPDNRTLTVCDLSEICIDGFSYDDPDGDMPVVVVTVNGAPAALVEGSVCFIPIEGDNVIALTATDACGAQVVCETMVDITLNQGPMVTCPDNRTLTVCDLSEICIDGFSYGDPDGDMPVVTVTVNGAPATLVEGEVCFIPVEGNNVIALTATDACGNQSSCITEAVVVLNSPPELVAYDSKIYLCQLQDICFTVEGSDPDGDSLIITQWEGPGEFTQLDRISGQTCFTPQQSDSATYVFVYCADDSCSLRNPCADGKNCPPCDEPDTIRITVILNRPPVVVCPEDAALTVCDLSEICIDGFEYSDPDGDLPNVTVTVNGVPAALVESEVCFIPVEGSNVIAVTATDECGAQAVCETVIDITLNQVPTVTCPDNRTLTVCDLSEICIDGFAYGDPDGDLPVVTVTVNGIPVTLVEGEVCLIPVEGSNVIAVTATDECGAQAVCETVVDITLNQEPTVTCPDNRTLTVCDLSEICIDGFDYGDPDGDLPDITVTVNGAPATLVEGEVCFIPVEGSNVIALTATDACGARAVCETMVDITLNKAPTVTCPENRTLTVCDLSEICIDGFEYSDPDGDLPDVTVTIDGEPATLVEGEVCFIPVEGSNVIAITATDECGAQVFCATQIDVVVNNTPVISCPEPSTISVCDLDAEITVAGFSYSDADDNLTSVVLTVNGVEQDLLEGAVSFVPEAGVNTIILTVSDICDEVSCTTQVEVIGNNPPELTCPENSAVQVCALGEEMTVDGFGYDDPDGNLLEVTLTVNGVPYDLVEGEVHFVPVAGVNTIILSATDVCGTVSCTTLVEVTEGSPLEVRVDDTTLYLCSPREVCLPVYVNDPDGTLDSVVATGGTYSNDTVCFTPYSGGEYNITVTAYGRCGQVSDAAVVTVATDEEIEIVCPDDTTIFTCALALDTFSFPIHIWPESDDISVAVSGTNAWYEAYDGAPDTIRFTSECSQSNHIVVSVTTPCSDYTCDFSVYVDCNVGPLVILPPDTDFLLCDPDEVCVPVGISDVNGNISAVYDTVRTVGGELVESSYDPATSKVCFYAETSGTYYLEVTATDACDVSNTDDIAIHVDLNTPPYIIYEWADSTIFTCVPEVCVPILIGDAESDQVTVTTEDHAYYDEDAGVICFTADTSGHYCVEVTAVDECGLAYVYEACVQIDVGDYIYFTSCPDDVIVAPPMCNPGETVCVDLDVDIIGNDYELRVEPVIGTYADGRLCFPADTAGDYTFKLIGDAECNSDTCVVSVRAVVSEPVQVFCPEVIDTLMCVEDPMELCFPVTFTGAGLEITVNDAVTHTPIGSYADGRVCIPIDQPVNYEIEIIAANVCGADTCYTNINAAFNSLPQVTSGNDISSTACIFPEIYIDFTVEDLDENVVEILTTHGQIVDGQVCYTPGDFGTDTVIITARDICGEGADTTFVTLVDGTPFITCPSGTLHFELCKPDSIPPVDVTIYPGDAIVTVLPNGSYDPDAGKVRVYVDHSAVYDVKIIAEAYGCSDTCEFKLDVTIVTAISVTCPNMLDTLMCLEGGATFCYPVSVTGDYDQVTVSPFGTFTGDRVCLDIDEPGTYNIELTASNRCESVTCYSNVTILGDQPPVLFLPTETLVFERCPEDTDTICIPSDSIYVTDPEGKPVTLTHIETGGCDTADFELVTANSGQLCFVPDGFGLYEFCFEADDGCNTTTGSFFVRIDMKENCEVCIRLSIVTTYPFHNCTPVGMPMGVNLSIETDEYLGGFDVLLSYDASVMSFNNWATIDGTVIDGWEYFEYRLNSANCTGICPSGLLRLVGVAEANAIGHPPDSTLNPNGVMVKMQFMVANDQNLESHYLPINFVTYDCGDNAFADTSGNEMYVDLRIYNIDGSVKWDEDDDVAFPESSRPNGLGTPDHCIGGGKIDPIRCIEFYNGGIWVCDKDSLDDRGDINLNGVPYEIADAVVFSNYFIHGLSVFQVNLAAQIAATDVNADGVTLSVADLVLLIRIIIGDADPVPKISPHEQPLLISTAYSEGCLNVATEAVSNIGAALLVFDLGADVAVDRPELGLDADGMDLIYIVRDGELRVLIYSLSANHVAAGKNDLIRISYDGRGDLRLTESQFVDYQGRPYNCVNKGAELPGKFTLRQNYPNPFNPVTSISFALPRQSAWTMRIYNVIGKLVREFEGSAAAGDHTITWNGLDAAGNSAASGVYFYRFEAAGYTETKKMVLLK